MDAFLRYDWPGNVRELQNVTDRLIYLADGKEISARYLPRNIVDALKKKTASSGLSGDESDENETVNLSVVNNIRRDRKNRALSEQRRDLIHALEAENGNIAAAARRLGISRATFYRKLKITEQDV